MTKETELERLKAKYEAAWAAALRVRVPSYANADDTLSNQEGRGGMNISTSKLANKWHDKNRWFGIDHDLTAVALGIHEQLLRLKIEADTLLYFSLIDLVLQGWKDPDNPLHWGKKGKKGKKGKGKVK